MSISSQSRSSSETTLAPTRFLRQPEVLERIGVSWVTILRWEKQGLFPQRRKIGPRLVAWLESEIDQWIADRATSVEGEAQ